MKKIVLSILTISLLSACVDSTTIAPLPDAENLYFSSDQRLFATGGDGLYHIVQAETESGFDSIPLMNDGCSFNGITEFKGWLFSACVKLTGRTLMAFDMSDLSNVHEVGSLTGFAIPNGMETLAEEGALLVADENFFGQAGVTKAVIIFEDGIPKLGELEHQWIGEDENVSKANGIRREGNQFYLTDLGQTKLVVLEGEQQLSEATILSDEFTIYDDLTPYCGGVVVTDFIFGNLIYITADHEKIFSTRDFSFAFPAAILPAQGDLFSDFGEGFIVAEKGMFFETNSDFGNKLVFVSAEELGFPACDL